MARAQGRHQPPRAAPAAACRTQRVLPDTHQTTSQSTSSVHDRRGPRTRRHLRHLRHRIFDSRAPPTASLAAPASSARGSSATHRNAAATTAPTRFIRAQAILIRVAASTTTKDAHAPHGSMAARCVQGKHAAGRARGELYAPQHITRPALHQLRHLRPRGVPR